MAEWLGTGLQNPLQRFESASDLQSKPPRLKRGGFFMSLWIDYQPLFQGNPSGFKLHLIGFGLVGIVKRQGKNTLAFGQSARKFVSQ